jgi:hypothetical protein
MAWSTGVICSFSPSLLYCIAGRRGYWLVLRVALVVVAVAQRRLGPSSSAATSTTQGSTP